MNTVYQDVWVKGRVVERGYRECANRYSLVRTFCERQFADRAFTVCDIGANNCYFGLRLLEDFPGCTVIAFEFDHFGQRATIVRANKTTRLLLLNRKVTLGDLTILAACMRFDCILALSVLHHVGGEFSDWLLALRRLGRHLLLELAGEDSVSRRMPTGHGIPVDATILGSAPSHLQRGMERTLLALNGRP